MQARPHTYFPVLFKSPDRFCFIDAVARPERLELPTLWFEARRSIQLSYGRAANTSLSTVYGTFFDFNLEFWLIPSTRENSPAR